VAIPSNDHTKVHNSLRNRHKVELPSFPAELRNDSMYKNNPTDRTRVMLFNCCLGKVARSQSSWRSFGPIAPCQDVNPGECLDLSAGMMYLLWLCSPYVCGDNKYIVSRSEPPLNHNQAL
jgi:hypothetical protein